MPRRHSRRPEPAPPVPRPIAHPRDRRAGLARRGRRRDAADGYPGAPRGRDRRLPTAATPADRDAAGAEQDGSLPAPDRARRPARRRDRRLRAGDERRRQRQSGAERPGDAEDRGRDDPRGLHALADGRRRQGRRAQRRLREGHGEGPEGLRHRQDRGSRDASARGVPVPGHLRAREGASVEDLVKDQLSAFNQNISQVESQGGGEEEPVELRRRHDRLDDRARGSGLPKERPSSPRSSTTGSRRASPSGSTRRSLRPRQLRQAADRVGPADRQLPYNTRLPGVPPTPIANPGLDSLKAAAGSGQRRLPLLRRQAGDVRGALLHQRLRRVPRRLRQVQLRPRGAGRRHRPTADGPSAPGDADEPAGGRRPSGRPLAVAGDAHGRLRGARHRRRTGATRRSTCAGSASRAASTSCASAASRVSTSPFPHKRRRLRARRRALGRRLPRSAQRTRSASVRRGGSVPTTPTRAGWSRRSPTGFDPAGAERAGARRRRLGPGGGLGAATAPAQRWTIAGPDRRRRRSTSPASSASTRSRGARTTNRLDVGALRPARQRHLGRPCKRRCGAARAGQRPKGPAPSRRSTGCPTQWWWTSYTGPNATELAAPCTSGGATLIDGLEMLVCQGADSFRIWVGQEPPVETMRRTIRDNR